MSTANSIKAAAIQMVSSPIVDENLTDAAAWIQVAAQKGARLVVLPEYFCIMGQHDTDKLVLREPPGSGPSQEFLSALARGHVICLVGGALPLPIPAAERVYDYGLVCGPYGRPQ